MGKSSSSKNNSSTSIPKAFQPYYTDIFNQGKLAASKVDTTPYGGRFLAQADPWQVQGQQARYDAATALPDQAGQGLIQLGQDTAAGKYLDPNSNPYLQSTIQAALRPGENYYRENTAGGINDAARKAGSFGGVRRDIVQQQGYRDFTKNQGDIAGNIAFQNYGMERGNQLNAGNTIQQGFQINQLKPSLIESAGADRQALAQNEIDNSLASYQDRITAPFRGINQQLPVLGLDIGRNQQGSSTSQSRSLWGIL